MGQLWPRGNSKQEKEIKHVAIVTGNRNNNVVPKYKGKSQKRRKKEKEI